MRTGGVFLAWAILLLVLPLNWVLAAFVAAVFHELCHILAVRLLGGRLLGARVGLFGTVLESAELPTHKSLLAVLAGPAGSLLLLIFLEHWPEMAVCGLAQGLYNLLPFYPLDGGRAVAMLPAKLHWLKVLPVALLVALAVTFRFPGLLLMLLPACREKYLANRRKKGYNNATMEMR